MQTAAMAARAQIASERIAAAAQSLGERFGLQEEADALVQAGHKDKLVDALFRSEAAADLFEALDSATVGTKGVEAEPKLLDGTVDEIATGAESIDDQAELEALIREEEAGKNRDGALNALRDRLDVLAAEADAKRAAEYAAPPPDVTVLEGTIPEVSDFLAGVESERDLAALEDAERSGKNRAGVMSAIAERRSQIAGAGN